MNAESAKAYAEAEKIKGVDTDAAKQGIKESETRIDEIIAKIPLSSRPLQCFRVWLPTSYTIAYTSWPQLLLH